MYPQTDDIEKLQMIQMNLDFSDPPNPEIPQTPDQFQYGSTTKQPQPAPGLQNISIMNKHVLKAKPMSFFEDKMPSQKSSGLYYSKRSLVPEDQLRKLPYSTIGIIQIRFPSLSNPFYGTGTLIGPRHVLTCKHNCYYEEIQEQASQLRFYLRVKGSLGESYKVVKMSFSRQKRYDVQNQFALLIIDHDISKNYGYIGLNCYQNYGQADDIIVAGFPYFQNTKDLYEAEGKMQMSKDRTLIQYYLETSQGQSGGPILKKINGVFQIIGIHIGGCQKKPCKHGLALQRKHLKALQMFQIPNIKMPHPFFEKFSLAPQVFQRNVNQVYNGSLPVYFSGGWPCFPPKIGMKFGLRVMNLYENDSWVKGQWATAYHAVSSPETICPNNMKVLQSIMSGMKEGSMLRPGSSQHFKDEKCLNKKEIMVGEGIYCCPQIATALQNTDQKAPYRLIFQCRVRPSAIRVTSCNHWWVINKSQDIRPYGIILIPKKDAQNYPSLMDEYPKQEFTWQRYGQCISYPC